jgi:hypothetical protein
MVPASPWILCKVSKVWIKLVRSSTDERASLFPPSLLGLSGYHINFSAAFGESW